MGKRENIFDIVMDPIHPVKCKIIKVNEIKVIGFKNVKKYQHGYVMCVPGSRLKKVMLNATKEKTSINCTL